MGDVAAIGDLYEIYIDTLVSYGIKVCGDKQHTMDCIHDLFVDLYKYNSKLSKTDNVKLYLFLSLKRKINKKYKRKEIILNSDIQYFGIQKRNDYAESIESKIIDSEIVHKKYKKLKQALNSLTNKQKEALSLRFEQNMSYEDISKMLSVTESSARTTVYRAVKILREQPFSLVYLSFLNFF
ncbi:sigma-70 family RNA polymerase sigma factor [Flavobacteriaceae bacterium MHTCC 0001]